MSEIIVISDDDLEEGEIADDIEPEPVIINEYKPKGKKLPRRYILHENKDLNSKHSKHKHSCRHRRKHHKSYLHHSIDRYKVTEKQFSHKKSSSSLLNRRENRSSYTLSDDIMKSAFKNFSSPRRETVASVKLNSSNLPVKNVSNPLPLAIDIEKTSNELKEKNENFSGVNTKKEDLSLPKCLLESNDEKLNLLPTKVSSQNELIESEIISKTKMDVDSEDEDEEELRRIALSTCLKRPATDLNHASDVPVANCNMNGLSNMNQNSSNQVSRTTPKSFDTFSSDNYEVVDMELDDDSLPENENTDDLFVIDRNPLIPETSEDLPNCNLDLNGNSNLLSRDVSNKVQENSLHMPSPQYQSNDDFEEELLRAEVIASMNSARKKTRKTPEKQSIIKNRIQTQLQVPPTKVPTHNNMKIIKSLSSYSKHPAPNFLNMTSRKVVNKAKLSYSKLLSQKKVAMPPQRKINAGPERLVITLNNDTSSDETDEDDDKNKDTGENVAVASIEALISDARQKSDIQKSTTIDSNSVSCLSKAQQIEYNALKQMLAQKQTLPKKSTAVNDKRTLRNKLIAEKIHDAKDNLNKERKVLKDVVKELLAKKQEYITSKLKVQHLKEQLHAAELVRRANLETWKNSAAKLDVQKKSITKYEAIVSLLEKKLDTNSQPQVQNPILSPSQRIDSPGT